MPTRPSWLIALGFLVLAAVAVGSLWSVPYLPTNDGPESVFAVHMENHFGDPGVIYPEVFEPAPQFAGRGFTILFEPLEDAFGWQRGLQVALSILVLVYALGVVAFVRAIDPRRTALAFFGFPLALSWALYMGFFAFVLSSGVGLLVLAFAIGARGEGLVRRSLVAALLLLQAFLHMFGAILAGVVLATIRVARAPRGGRLVELRKVALTGAPAATLALLAVVVARAGAVKATFSSDFVYRPLREVLLTWPRVVAPGGIATASVVGVGLAAAVGVIAVRARRSGTSSTDRALAVLAIAFLITSLAAPRDVPGWQLFSQRFVGIALVLVIAAVPLERVTRTRAFPPLAFAASLAWTWLAYPLHRRLASETADVLASLAAPVKLHGIWLPVKLTPPRRATTAEVPILEPLWHIDALYETALGGLSPYTFASNPASWPFALRRGGRHPPPVPNLEQLAELLELPAFQTDPAFRDEQESVLATFGMFYEAVVVTGIRPSDHALWERRGFVSDWSKGSVMIAHFEPCTLDVTVPGTSPPPLLDVGVAGTTVLRDARVLGTPDGDDRVRLRVEHGPCGRVWVRPHWEGQNGDAKESSLCTNARTDGHIEVMVTRKGGEAACLAAAR